MLAIDEAKLPPPTPASAATRSSVAKDTPGRSTTKAVVAGIRSTRALKIVQLRPPNFATANVYGKRRAAPTAVGSVVSRNFCDGSRWYSGPRNSTSTAHNDQIEKPMCSRSEERRVGKEGRS